MSNGERDGSDYAWAFLKTSADVRRASAEGRSVTAGEVREMIDRAAAQSREAKAQLDRSASAEDRAAGPYIDHEFDYDPRRTHQRGRPPGYGIT